MLALASSTNEARAPRALSKNIFLQGRAAWGRQISPYLTYTDEFDTTRWLVSSTLSGHWQYGPWKFRPSATVSYIEDTSKSYTDSLGVVIPDVKSRLGQAKAGPSVAYTFRMPDGSVLEPRAGFDVIWNFAADNSTISGGLGDPAAPIGVRGSVELGLRATSYQGITIDLSATYDGIGASDWDAITGRARARIPFD
jgi:outer membrane autotransporter protein